MASATRITSVNTGIDIGLLRERGLKIEDNDNSETLSAGDKVNGVLFNPGTSSLDDYINTFLKFHTSNCVSFFTEGDQEILSISDPLLGTYKIPTGASSCEEDATTHKYKYNINQNGSDTVILD